MMMRSIAARFLRSSAAILLCLIVGSTAKAGSIPSYTATELGPDQRYTLSNTGADGTLTTATGMVYAFSRTDNSVANPQPLINTFPPFTNAPVNNSMTYGNPNDAYSFLDPSRVFLNKAGQFVATDLIGVLNHSAGSESILDMATKQANGTFGPLMPLWSSPSNNYFGGPIAQALDLNNTGQVLGVTAAGYGYYYPDFFLYDLHSGIKTELASLLPNGWTLSIPIAIDDQGRILVSAEKSSLELLLLTPPGLSSNPIPTPEPSTLAIFAVAGLALAIRRRWKS